MIAREGVAVLTDKVSREYTRLELSEVLVDSIMLYEKEM